MPKHMTEGDKLLFCHLIKNHVDIIESKKNDAKIIEMKNKKWSQLTIEYNSSGNVCFRSEKQLKGMWKELKKSARKDIALFRRERQAASGSGGGDDSEGRVTFTQIPQLTETVMQLVPTLVECIKGVTDDDESYVKDLDGSDTQHLNVDNPQASNNSGQPLAFDIHTSGNVVTHSMFQHEPLTYLTSAVEGTSGKGTSACNGTPKRKRPVGKHSEQEARKALRDTVVRGNKFHDQRSSYLKMEHEAKMNLLSREMEMKEEEHKAAMSVLQARESETALNMHIQEVKYLNECKAAGIDCSMLQHRVEIVYQSRLNQH